MHVAIYSIRRQMKRIRKMLAKEGQAGDGKYIATLFFFKCLALIVVDYRSQRDLDRKFVIL